MINFMVANFIEKKGNSLNRLLRLLDAQVENSVELGWRLRDIIVISTFKYVRNGVSAIEAPLNDFCLTGSKMFGLQWWLKESGFTGTVWSHDLDAWQNWSMEEPEFADVGVAQYSNSRMNGGSLFWRRTALDMVDDICTRIGNDKLRREEPTINAVFKSKEYKDRVTIINNTYNVGCSGYVVRYRRSELPLKVCHFHPDNRIAWETHTLDRNNIGEVGVSVRLERLLRRHYPKLACKITSRRKEGKENEEKK